MIIRLMIKRNHHIKHQGWLRNCLAISNRNGNVFFYIDIFLFIFYKITTRKLLKIIIYIGSLLHTRPPLLVIILYMLKIQLLNNAKRKRVKSLTSLSPRSEEH